MTSIPPLGENIRRKCCVYVYIWVILCPVYYIADHYIAMLWIWSKLISIKMYVYTSFMTKSPFCACICFFLPFTFLFSLLCFNPFRFLTQRATFNPSFGNSINTFFGGGKKRKNNNYKIQMFKYNLGCVSQQQGDHAVSHSEILLQVMSYFFTVSDVLLLLSVQETSNLWKRRPLS